jgi:two-component system response regulator (stage 0 sporulation protein F)
MDNMRLLLVDDDIELGLELTDLLTQEGYLVTTISDTTEAVKVIESQEHDINILDFKMPGLNGIDLVKKIKQKNPNTKVIMVTGRPFIEKLIKEENVSDLIDGLIGKPFKIEELFEQIKELSAVA